MDSGGILESIHWSVSTWAVVIGIITGFFVRICILKIDFRQYPSYPYGCIVHLSLGLIASALGAVAVPALLARNYIAVTFLALAAQQFREVRRMERETLTRLDITELVPRGTNYIEGMAMVFEGRNYVVIAASLLSSSLVMFTGDIHWGLLGGLLLVLGSRFLLKNCRVGDIAEVSEAEITFYGANVYVDHSYLTNMGIDRNRKVVREKGKGFVIQPRHVKYEVALSNLGQRQAILHDASSILGVYRDRNRPSLVPMAKRDLTRGRLVVLLLPLFEDPYAVPPRTGREVIQGTLVLENSVRSPLGLARLRWLLGRR
ncbi:YIEGIA domain-containing protein [Pasteuria penetrans]|uniref:YIEGIA domain-containing protein n=1 Tax=Pasteuria penetrans TaxID=86005 RepID=UPI0011EF85ED|nr:YIEGIA domain-containing protein [Pasteuria penetrans]